jgi:hypothetical protein
MSVFPNDVWWFRSFLKLNIFSQKFTKTTRNNAFLNLLVYRPSSTITFFCFESCKTRTWSLKLIKFFLVLQNFWYFCVNFFYLFPFFSFNCISSFL